MLILSECIGLPRTSLEEHGCISASACLLGTFRAKDRERFGGSSWSLGKFA